MKETTPETKSIPTIWSHNVTELIPYRIRIVIRVVMPIIYTLMILFGITSLLFPIQTFISVVGLNYGYIWSGLIGVVSTTSLIGLILKTRLELYSSIVLTIFLLVYPIYVITNDAMDGNVDHISSFFAAILYLVMPCWRVIDISIDIRKSRRRQLYAESTQGGT
jgi:hypothetical protein